MTSLSEIVIPSERYCEWLPVIPNDPTLKFSSFSDLLSSLLSYRVQIMSLGWRSLLCLSILSIYLGSVSMTEGIASESLVVMW